ncbi:hypothetical protein [Laceyella putida]|uniref:Uncharacterized protein n=1 Tax=Laceyella putida TaxID=110101 RepID=A0ABW2RJS5_9BACL
MAWKGKKWLAGVAVVGLIGGGTWLGAKQSGYADMEDWFQGKNATKQVKNQTRQERLTELTNMNEQELRQLAAEHKLTFKQAAIAATIAAKTGKPVSEVITEWKEKGSWREVIKGYGINGEDLKKKLAPLKKKHKQFKNKPAVLYEALATYLGTDVPVVQQTLYQSRVRVEGAVHAAVLAKASGHKWEDVIALKQQKKSWSEVRKALRIDEKKWKEAKREWRDKWQAEMKEWRSQWPEKKQA